MRIGVDMEELSRFTELIQKPRFVLRVLTENEYQVFNQLNTKRKIEYLAGRWVAKEAFAKAYGTGIGKLSFQEIEVLNEDNGAPYFSKFPKINGQAEISLSHTNTGAIAFVVIEGK
ncbi:MULTISPECIES: holo-ACP synthase [unclassified Enterococcus]|uniref:holo-ACP synthase n=1 Tax=unclassified Enterococcus TaxID=2608891 RepID=UPI00155169ED|nr:MULTISPECIES: holo-ACP synthase [unclassified Enterococcus]MBS7577255.1 holo-ACP synthase [Enterococcus sp. MMGLQ5-2]MBS7584652.1 holo-ACP synthase [Enterococcus sp. MMGLQ5-1]NPD12507.1 holo-ACP synthase [Enterococcus sp. MMGLQ5-1]NPD37089.1 holo-ACP synthase [Enterococcus sp. MMGLQ5-2]